MKKYSPAQYFIKSLLLILIVMLSSYNTPIFTEGKLAVRAKKDFANDNQGTSGQGNSISDYINGEDPETITFLDLRNKGLTELPEDIWKLKNLSTLLISNNHIKTFPEKFEQLKKLYRVYASHNEFESISVLFSIKSLHELEFGDNKIDSIDAGINNLESLTYLNLENNNIKYFPETIKLDLLEILNVANNKLEKLPKNILERKNLQKLSAGNNLISNFSIPQKTSIRITSLELRGTS